MIVYLVHCPRCMKGTTVSVPPGHDSYVPNIDCVVCGDRVDASNVVKRRLRPRARRGRVRRPDLLEIK
jgi:hypothetical protein